MAEFEELRLTVNLVDNASVGLRNLNTQIALLGGAVDKTLKPVLDAATKQMKLLAVETREANKSVGEIRKDLEHFGSALIQIGQQAGLIGQIGAIGGLVGIIGGINSALGTFAEKMLALRAASLSAGLVPDQFMNIARQLRQILPSADQADAVLIKFMRTMREVTRAGTPEFERLRALTAGPDRNVMLGFARRLSQDINRGEVEKSIVDAARAIRNKYLEELARSGPQEAVRQAEAMGTVLGLDLDTANQIAQRGLTRFGGDKEWQRRVELGQDFKVQLEKSNEAWEDMIYGMQQQMLPTMMELNKFAKDIGEEWGQGIGRHIKEAIRDVKQITTDIVWLVNFLKGNKEDVERRLNERQQERQGGGGWLPDWLKNLFSVTPAGAATMPGGPGTAFPGTGGGPMGGLPGLPQQQALPRVGPTPSMPGGPTAPSVPSAPPSPVPYSPAPIGPGGIPGVPRAPSGSSVGPGVGAGAGQTPATGLGPGDFEGRFRGLPGGVPGLGKEEFEGRFGGAPSGSDFGPGVGAGAGQTPPGGLYTSSRKPGLDTSNPAIRNALQLPRLSGESDAEWIARGQQALRGATATDISPPSLAPRAALPPGGAERPAWPRTLPGRVPGQPIGVGQPGISQFGLPAVPADYVPKVLGEPAAPSTGGGGGTAAKLGDLNIQDISGQSARAGRAGELRNPQAIITHFTGGGTLGGAVSTLNQRGLGYNYIVDKDGKIHQFTPTGKTGAHMRSGWGETGQGLSNANTIGISAVATGEKDMTPAQIESMKNLTAALGTQHGISPKNVFGHGEVNPGHRSVGEGSTIYSWARGLDGWPAGGGGPPTAQPRQGAPTPAAGGGWPTRAPMTAWPGAAGGGLAAQRARFAAEMQNPEVRDRMAALVEAEVGSQGPQARQALIESIYNRAASRGQSLERTMQADYYSPMRTGKFERALSNLTPEQRAATEALRDQVASGSNISNFATGNWSGRPGGGLGGRGGFETKAFGEERFSVQAADVKWAQQARMGGQPATAVPFLTGKDVATTEGGWTSGIAGLDRGVLDGAMGREAAKVEGQGNLNVNVTDKRGAGVQEGTSNLFQPKPVERMTQHEPAKEGPSKPESTPDPIDLPEVEIKGGDRGGDED